MGSDDTPNFSIYSYLNILIRSTIPDYPVTLSKVTMVVGYYSYVSLDEMYKEQPNIDVQILKNPG